MSESPLKDTQSERDTKQSEIELLEQEMKDAKADLALLDGLLKSGQSVLDVVDKAGPAAPTLEQQMADATPAQIQAASEACKADLTALQGEQAENQAKLCAAEVERKKQECLVATEQKGLDAALLALKSVAADVKGAVDRVGPSQDALAAAIKSGEDARVAVAVKDVVLRKEQLKSLLTYDKFTKSWSKVIKAKKARATQVEELRELAAAERPLRAAAKVLADKVAALETGVSDCVLAKLIDPPQEKDKGEGKGPKK